MDEQRGRDSVDGRTDGRSVPLSLPVRENRVVDRKRKGNPERDGDSGRDNEVELEPFRARVNSTIPCAYPSTTTTTRERALERGEEEKRGKKNPLS